ncbi:hypothetical protein CGZ77_01475 [Neisseria sp. KEM232]|uniref:hypothetical protein n=1 Tax=Neisseria sp. KEM232 TaxID=655307 RepID=UPI000B8BE4AA|nr:hypothetical protein CGZ77_01475 [Neisseria sp. KEM232]
MDTTYFGRTFGVMVLFDSISGKALPVSEAKYETNTLYAQAIGRLKAKGILQSLAFSNAAARFIPWLSRTLKERRYFLL